MAQTKEGALKHGAKQLGIPLEEYLRHVHNKEKWCTTCKEWKRWGEFAKGKGSFDLGAQCKECQNAYCRSRYTPALKPWRKRGRKSLLERFMEYVKKGSGCWEWQGAKARSGYGQFHYWVNGGWKGHRAHRVMWEITNGPIPTGMVVCHKCDNPPCVRPDHLFLGTHRDNTLDSLAKGRACISNCKPQRGERNGSAKLNDHIVGAIRLAREAHGYTFKVLSDMFGISPSQIANIIHRRSWK